MDWRAWIAIVASVGAAGCATTITDHSTLDEALAVGWIEHNATVTPSILYLDGDTVLAVSLEKRDTLLWARLYAGDSTSLRPDAVRTIVFRNSSQGAADGVRVGTMLGVSFGLLAGLASEPAESGEIGLLSSRASAGILAGLATSLVTIPLGALFGHIAGHRTRIVFPD